MGAHAPRRKRKPTLSSLQERLTFMKLSPVRRIFNLSTPMYYLCEVYQCRSTECRKVISSDEKSLISSLSHKARNSFPIIKTEKLGMTRRLSTAIMAIGTSGSNMSEFQGILQEVYAVDYHQRTLQYLSNKRDERHIFELKHTEKFGFRWDPNCVEAISNRISQEWMTPSVDHFQDVLISLLQQRQVECDNYMSELTGTVLAMDHTFETAKCIRLRGEAPFRSHFVVHNEIGEILAAVYTRNESFDTLHNVLSNIASRPGSKAMVIYVDNCCTVRSKIQRHFPSAHIKCDLWHWLHRFAAVIPRTSASNRQKMFYTELCRSVVEPLTIALSKKEHLDAHEKVIPRPAKLFSKMELLKEKYSDIFTWNPKLASLWPYAIAHIERDCLSDPTDVNLTRVDKDMVYRSSRGTNICESFHSRLKAKVKLRARSSAETVDALTRSFIYRSNVKCAVRFKSAPDMMCFDALLFRTLKETFSSLFLGADDARLCNSPFALLPVAKQLTTHELFFTQYVHPVQSGDGYALIPHSLSDNQLSNVRSWAQNKFGCEPVFLGKDDVEFNFALSATPTKHEEKVRFLGGECTAASMMSTLEYLCAGDPCILRCDTSRVDKDTTFERVLEHLSKPENDVEEVITKVSHGQLFLPLVRSLANVISSTVLVLHELSHVPYLVVPFDSVSPTPQRHRICGVCVLDIPGVGIFKTFDTDFDVGLGANEEIIMVDDLPVQHFTATGNSNACHLATHLHAPRIDPRQRNVIVKFNPLEVHLLLQCVIDEVRDKSSRHIPWPKVLSRFSSVVKENEDQYRFPRDFNQLRVAYQNRLCYKECAEDVKSHDEIMGELRAKEDARKKRGRKCPNRDSRIEVDGFENAENVPL